MNPPATTVLAIIFLLLLLVRIIITILQMVLGNEEKDVEKILANAKKEDRLKPWGIRISAAMLIVALIYAFFALQA